MDRLVNSNHNSFKNQLWPNKIKSQKKSCESSNSMTSLILALNSYARMSKLQSEFDHGDLHHLQLELQYQLMSQNKTTLFKAKIIEMAC